MRSVCKKIVKAGHWFSSSRFDRARKANFDSPATVAYHRAMKVLRAAEMREVDRLTAVQYGTPGLLLMENAAARTVEAVEKKFGSVSGRRALIVCGKGNNGGDGAAIARQLRMQGCEVELLLLGRIEDAQGDARINFEIAKRMATGAAFRLTEVESVEQLQRSTAASFDFIFDALLGTGLARPAQGLFEAAIDAINQMGPRAAVIAVDLPSGLSSDSAEIIGPAVRAHLTVTFTAPKPASVLPPACFLGGELVVAQIGSPAELIIESGSQLNLIEREMVSLWLAASRRGASANKGDAGKALIIAGSRGKTGAACLAGQGAMRAGAGLVTIATPVSWLAVVAAESIPECMTEPLVETADGCVSFEAAPRAIELASARDVVAIGPGLGSSDESTRKFAREVVINRPRPAIIDADALNALAPWGAELRGSREFPLILTPHPGEMARLIGKTVAEVLADRVEVARDFAAAHDVILILKGSRTLVAAPDGEVYINPTGNAGMASGGTGDALTGIVAGLLAQKTDDPLGAAIAAVYLHGLAGDIAASRAGTRAMIASDINASLGQAFIEAGGDDERFDR